MNPFQIDRKKKIFCCRVCHKSLATRSLRTQHELDTHPKKQRPFSCPTCQKGFFTIPHLLSHTKVHSPTKTLHCFKCCFSTKWKSSLVRHQAMESHHINKWNQAHGKKGQQSVVPFNCQECATRTTVRVPNYNLVIANVRGADGKMKRIRFQPPTKESREWLRQRHLATLKRKRDATAVEGYQVPKFDDEFN